MRFLLTNDDSHRSPLLDIAVRYFSKRGEVDLVVPMHEQSWTGKSMTRFRHVHVRDAIICGRQALSVEGTPADCVNLAIHNLLPTKPDLVVSGINAGFNMGIGFLLSSGTVGAAIEGNLAGIPAIAISQAFDSATRNRYIAEYAIEPELVARFEKQTIAVLDRFLEIALSPQWQGRFLGEPITWNINMPFEVSDAAVVRFSPLGTTRYSGCFVAQPTVDPNDRSFNHSMVREVRDTNPNCDSSRISSGCATISPIDVWRLTGGDGGSVRDLCAELPQ